jgi:hypothetical protein
MRDKIDFKQKLPTPSLGIYIGSIDVHVSKKMSLA